MTAAGELLSARRYVLLDFDGPVCAVFGRLTNVEVADQLRLTLTAAGVSQPLDIQRSPDPFDVLRFASSIDRTTADAVDHEFRRLEADAVSVAPTAPGIEEALAALARSAHFVAVVSNNDTEAIRSFLDKHDLAQYVAVVVGRDGSDADRLKPSPHLLHSAVTQIGATVDQCVMVGDSVSDIQAARAFGCAVIAYANKPGKVETFADHDPDATITDMAQLRPVDEPVVLHQKSYVCVHVFTGERPVLYVTRPEGDWCFLCGDEHPDDASYYRVVGLGHLVDRDSSLIQVLDLRANEEAERSALGQPWVRSTF